MDLSLLAALLERDGCLRGCSELLGYTSALPGPLDARTLTYGLWVQGLKFGCANTSFPSSPLDNQDLESSSGKTRKIHFSFD